MHDAIVPRRYLTVSSIAFHIQDKKRREGRREKGEEGIGGRGLGFCCRRCRRLRSSMVAVLPPAETRLGSTSYLACPIDPPYPFAVHEGLAMYGVDRNNKAFVAARIVSSWIGDDGKVKRQTRRSRRREFQHRARCGSLGEKPNINPLHLIKFCGLKRLFGLGLVEKFSKSISFMF